MLAVDGERWGPSMDIWGGCCRPCCESIAARLPVERNSDERHVDTPKQEITPPLDARQADRIQDQTGVAKQDQSLLTACITCNNFDLILSTRDERFYTCNCRAPFPGKPS